ncbi:MAG: hypothetical protein SV375_11785, partial [Thermodesulfobacteriota bacterium]|nr:hypothetical protein [Thermodesulfobacteriota bacterium]
VDSHIVHGTCHRTYVFRDLGVDQGNSDMIEIYVVAHLFYRRKPVDPCHIREMCPFLDENIIKDKR